MLPAPMSHPESVEPAPPPGYPSREAKKLFGWRVLVLLGVSGALQFVVPMVVTLGIMGVSIVDSVRSGALTRLMKLDSAVVSEGKLSFVATEAGGGTCTLMQIGLVEPREAAKVAATFASSAPYDCPTAVVRDGTVMWLVGGSSATRIDRGSVVTSVPPTMLGEHSLPFPYQGRPTVLEVDAASDWQLMTLDGGDWQALRRISLTVPFTMRSAEDRFRVVVDDETLHLFAEDTSGTIFYVAVGPDGRMGSSGWEPVPVHASTQWAGGMDDGVPTVAVRTLSGLTMSVEGWRREAGGWSHTFTQRVQGPGELGLVDVGGSGRLDVISEGVFRSVEVAHIEGASVAGVDRYGGIWMLEPGNMMLVTWGIMLGLLPLALGTGAWLSVWMARYRVQEHEHEGIRVTLASPIRRGFAKILDRAVPMVPAVAATFLFGVKLSQASSPGFLRDHLLFSTLVGAWWLLWIGAMSYLEGRWGQTPGKRLMGIRVLGMELLPCGFWRALIRNLLEFIDGLFTYSVGLISIAFSKSWQRAGDVAARTIVVDTRRGDQGSRIGVDGG